MATSKVTLKLLIDRKNQRVLFAEARKDFVDFLFSLLALPVATFIRLIDNQDIVGGLSKLYQSVSDLSDDYIQSNQNKDVLLKPKSSLLFFSPQVPLLPTDVLSSSSSSSSSDPNYASDLYKCDSIFCSGLRSTFSRTCPSCHSGMSTIDDHYVLKSDQMDARGGGFVKGLVTYMVMDDLAVSPMSMIANITLLSKFNVKDLDALEQKVVHIGMDEGLQLLKHSLTSKTVLTIVFFGEVVVEHDNQKKV